MICFLCYNANSLFFSSTHEFQWVQAILSKEEGERGNHDKLSFFQVIIILFCLCQIVPQTQQSASPAQPTPPTPWLLFIPFGSTSTFAYLSHFRGCNDELNCFQSFPSELFVVTSLNIVKDNAFHNHFNLNLSIIMMEGDSLNFIRERIIHFSSLHVASKLCVSNNTTLIYNLQRSGCELLKKKKFLQKTNPNFSWENTVGFIS
jgi:hypothetical protein